MRQLIERLLAQGKRVVLTAGPDEVEKTMAAEIAQGQKVLNLAGAVSLKELGALIERSECLICVDSVPFHLANALKHRVVALFGPTSDVTWGRGATLLRRSSRSIGAAALAISMAAGGAKKVIASSLFLLNRY